MSKLKFLVEIIIFLLISVPSLPACGATPSMALPNCPDKCGNVDIPYPFGIGENCYHNTSFEIICNHSFTPYKPFLRQFNLEVLNITYETVTLNNPIGATNTKCLDGVSEWNSTNFAGSPLRFSLAYNTFTVVGCDTALLRPSNGTTVIGCTPKCVASNDSTTPCVGIGSCETYLPYWSSVHNYTISINCNHRNCTTKALLARDNWYSRNSSNLSAIYQTDQAPVVMLWYPRYGYDYGSKIPDYDGCFAPDPNSSYISCECGWAYEGNPYIPNGNGCKVAPACANCDLRDCTQDRYGKPYCNRIRSYKTEIILGSSLGGGLLFLVLCGFCFWVYKLIKKKQNIKLKKKFFKRNGGLLLEQQISSSENKLEKTIVFTSKELEKATDNFNENRILGQGGQGTVYKGMLIDGKIVAIKKSKVIDESQLEQFINEVVILSQINHRNIVRLLGCCLETEVPLLVYEFIPNGNLFQLIHNQNEEFPLSWKMRLQIATEIAGALTYLHSATSTPIYHRDIKSTNILLDEKFRAKVADFGTSRSISIEQTHLTTVVHGTFGYLDPEYFQSSQFTEKSDVYSYGVVLVELLTGEKAISSLISEEERSLATRFILSLKEVRLFDLVDSRVKEEAMQEEIIVFANIAKRCLSLSGRKRPTMKEVMMELEGIRMSQMLPLSNFHQDQYIMEMKGPIDTTSSSIQSGVVYRGASSSDVDPLLGNTV